MNAQQLGTRAQRLGNVVKQELWTHMGYCRDIVTLADPVPTETLAVGTVLGQVTATGEWVVSVQTASDGSEVPAGIVVEQYDLSDHPDGQCVALVRGPAIVADDALILDASWDGLEEDAFAAFKAIGILVYNQV